MVCVKSRADIISCRWRLLERRKATVTRQQEQQDHLDVVDPTAIWEVQHPHISLPQDAHGEHCILSEETEASLQSRPETPPPFQYASSSLNTALATPQQAAPTIQPNNQPPAGNNSTVALPSLLNLEALSTANHVAQETDYDGSGNSPPPVSHEDNVPSFQSDSKEPHIASTLPPPPLRGPPPLSPFMEIPSPQIDTSYQHLDLDYDYNCEDAVASPPSLDPDQSSPEHLYHVAHSLPASSSLPAPGITSKGPADHTPINFPPRKRRRISIPKPTSSQSSSSINDPHCVQTRLVTPPPPRLSSDLPVTSESVFDNLTSDLRGPCLIPHYVVLQSSRMLAETQPAGPLSQLQQATSDFIPRNNLASTGKQTIPMIISETNLIGAD